MHTYQECGFASFPENLNLKGFLHFPNLKKKKKRNIITYYRSRNHLLIKSEVGINGHFVCV